LKLFWIKLLNYRQYRGESLIEFSTSNDKPVTIVEGTTGAGKTTLLNAMYWCLYGEEPAFHESELGVAPICNSVTLREASGITDMSVELAFGEAEPKYFFKRKLTIWNLDKLQPSPEVIKVSVSVENSDRLTTVYINKNLHPLTVTFDVWTKERSGDNFSQAPDYQVDNILPHDLAFVFLFNGEELKEFFERKNLQQALEDISQITLVKRAIDQLDAVATDLRRAASKGSAGTEALSQKLDVTERLLEDRRMRARDLEEEISKLGKELEKVDAELKSLNIERVSYLVETRNDAVRRTTELARDLQKLDDERNKLLLETAPPIYLQGQIDFALTKIGEFDQRGKLPPPIRTVFLKDLLEKGTCICGRSIDENSSEPKEARRHIHKLLEEETSDEAISFKAMDGRYKLKGILESLSTNLAELAEIGEKAAVTEATLIQAEEKTRSVDKELAQYASPGRPAEDLAERVRSLQSNRGEIEKARVQALSDLGGDQRDIERLEKEVKESRKLIDQELKKKVKGEILKNRWALCEKSWEMLVKIKDDMVSEVRSEIQRGADSHFRDLVWKTTSIERKAGERPPIDPQKLQRVEIDSNNEISVITKNGENWIRSLSQGETQTLAYSFISALKEGARVAFPMVVDTPLGIIDEGPPRELFAELLPEFVKDTQLIFLMTSAEYTANVRRILSNKVGRAFRLSYQPSEETTRVERIA